MISKSILLVVIATLFTTIAQLLFKLGSSPIGMHIGLFPINLLVLSGFLSYGVAAFLFIQALKGKQLSVIYPLWSLSFVWIFIVSMFFLGEAVNMINWLGIVFIMIGLSLIGRGEKSG